MRSRGLGVRRACAVGAVIALSAFAGCFGGGALTGPAVVGTGSGTGSGGGTSLDVTLEGRWSRTEILMANGDLHSSQTIWQFASDGSATRTVIATDLSGGIGDTVVAHARWKASGGTVTISFEAPDSGVVSFAYRIDGQTLTLGGEQFARIA